MDIVAKGPIRGSAGWGVGAFNFPQKEVKNKSKSPKEV
jgi:hypothetical protein